MDKSEQMYVLVHLNEDDETLYIHFDPKKKNYLVGNTLVGACIFTKQKAQAFIHDYLDPNGPIWTLRDVNFK